MIPSVGSDKHLGNYMFPDIADRNIVDNVYDLYCIVLYYIVLYCIVLYCIVLYCIVLYCIVLYCIVLYCIVLYCIVLYCIVRPYTDVPIGPLSHRHSSGVVRNPHSALASEGSLTCDPYHHRGPIF